MTSGKVIAVPFRVLSKKGRNCVCLLWFLFVIFIYVQYSLHYHKVSIYVKYRFLQENSWYLLGVKIILGHAH